MKKYIFIVLFIIFSSNNLLAQNYVPIPMDSAAWNVSWGCSVCNNCYLTFLTKPNGDTLINSINYKKFYKYGVSGGCFPCACPYYFAGFYQGGIRQDSILRKIYIILPNDSIEKILYDFNQTVGDTINSVLSNICYPEVISSVDSVLISGIYRKRIISDANGCNNLGNEFIEGIGSLKGLIESTIWFEYGSTLNCFNHNGLTIYPDTNFVCLNYVSVKEPDDKPNFSVYPNPFKENLTIKTSNPLKNTVIKLLDVFGRQLLQREIIKAEITIDRTNLPSGIYFYQISSESKIISTGKIIAE